LPSFCIASWVCDLIRKMRRKKLGVKFPPAFRMKMIADNGGEAIKTLKICLEP